LDAELSALGLGINLKIIVVYANRLLSGEMSKFKN